MFRDNRELQRKIGWSQCFDWRVSIVRDVARLDQLDRVFDRIFNLNNLTIMGKYKAKRSDSLKLVRELPPVTATALKNETADVLDQVARDGAVLITKHDKPSAVLLPLDQYTEFFGSDDEQWLEDLHEEYRGMLDKMQEPEQKAAAERLFKATPEELGAAALRGYQRNNS